MAKFILSKSKVIEQYNIVKEISDQVSYSSKTNQDVTRILDQETDCMFSVHLKNELKHIEDKSRVWFLSQCWTKEQIIELMDMGIDSFVVDNENDLDILIESVDISKINLLLRVKLQEMSIRTEKYFVFGIGSEIVNKRIKELKGKTKSLGVHFHRKTQNMSEWRLIYELSEMFDEEVFEIIDFVNIGGGIPSVYANTNVDVIQTVINKIKEFKDWLNEKNIKMIIEPGRFIAAPAVKLETNILGIFEKNIVVDASTYNTDMDALIVPVKLLIEGELNEDIDGKNSGENSSENYVVKGKTPCSLDLFRYRVKLNDPKVGDKLVFLNAGAYNFTTDFCDLEKLDTEVVE